MAIQILGGSPSSPGNELYDDLGSKSAAENGSQIDGGISDPVIDVLIEIIVKSPDRSSLATASGTARRDSCCISTMWCPAATSSTSPQAKPATPDAELPQRAGGLCVADDLVDGPTEGNNVDHGARKRANLCRSCRLRRQIICLRNRRNVLRVARRHIGAERRLASADFPREAPADPHRTPGRFPSPGPGSPALRRAPGAGHRPRPADAAGRRAAALCA